MASSFKYHPFNGDQPSNYYSHQMFGAWDRLVEDLAGDNDPNLIELVEMFEGDEKSIEVVMFDGEPIGVLDEPSIGLSDLARFETYEQMQLREAEEDAARESHADVARELRAAE
jgi:hypothetical protein